MEVFTDTPGRRTPRERVIVFGREEITDLLRAACERKGIPAGPAMEYELAIPKRENDNGNKTRNAFPGLYLTIRGDDV